MHVLCWELLNCVFAVNTGDTRRERPATRESFAPAGYMFKVRRQCCHLMLPLAVLRIALARGVRVSCYLDRFAHIQNFERSD